MGGKRRRGGFFSPEIYVGCGLVNKAPTNETRVILLGYPRYPNYQISKWENVVTPLFPNYFRSGSSFTGELLLSGDPTDTWYDFEPLAKFTPFLDEIVWQQENYRNASKG